MPLSPPPHIPARGRSQWEFPEAAEEKPNEFGPDAWACPKCSWNNRSENVTCGGKRGSSNTHGCGAPRPVRRTRAESHRSLSALRAGLASAAAARGPLFRPCPA